MSASGFHTSCLHDDRLAPLATSALPAWLWSTDATRIIWANPIGAAIFGAPTSAEIGARSFDPGELAAAQIASIAATLPPGTPPRLECLRDRPPAVETQVSAPDPPDDAGAEHENHRSRRRKRRAH